MFSDKIWAYHTNSGMTPQLASVTFIGWSVHPVTDFWAAALIGVKFGTMIKHNLPLFPLALWRRCPLWILNVSPKI